MIIYTIWVSDGHEEDDAWMADAWDEFTRDGNDIGYEKAINELESKHASVTVVPVSVSWNAVADKLRPRPIDGTVVESA